MRRAAIFSFLAVSLAFGPIRAEMTPADRLADYDYLIDQIASHYAYLPERHLNLEKLRTLYRGAAESAAGRNDFLHMIEKVVGELHDPHATLNRNTPSSPQLIPTGAELWAEFRGGRAIITEVRPESPAEKAGLRAGAVLENLNGISITEAVRAAAPKALIEPDPDADNATLRVLLAGTHEGERRLSLSQNGARKEVTLAPYAPLQSQAPVTARKLEHGIGYIRIENSLGDTETVAAFDAAVKKLGKIRALILDLRNTPSGGNTDVAEPILGRFIAKPAAYQRVFEPGPGKSFPKDSWLKMVSPRGPRITAKLVVLCDHWTGSMGEGMTIGLDALRHATSIGTPMAGLRGGTGPFTLPHSGITVHFPIERLYHVDGTPREFWQPRILIDLTTRGPGDVILNRALEEARR